LFRSVAFDQTGLLQNSPLSGVHDQGSLVPSLEGATPFQKQANGAAVLPCFDSYRGGHGYSLLQAELRHKRR